MLSANTPINANTALETTRSKNVACNECVADAFAIVVFDKSKSVVVSPFLPVSNILSAEGFFVLTKQTQKGDWAW